jgi:hypothetical protein
MKISSGIQNLEVSEFRSIKLIEKRREKIGTEKIVRFLEVSGFQKFRNSEVTLYDKTTC